MHVQSMDRSAFSGANPQKRIIALGIVGAIHIAVIWTIINGLVPQSLTRIIPDITVIPVPPADVDHPPPPPVQVKFEDPTIPTVVEPDWDVASDSRATAITATRTDLPPRIVAMTALQGVMNTHTIPPYPPIAVRLQQQGTVTLRIEVGPDGQIS